MKESNGRNRRRERGEQERLRAAERSREQQHYVPPNLSKLSEREEERERYATEESKHNPEYCASGFTNPRFEERGERSGWDYRGWLRQRERRGAARREEPEGERIPPPSARELPRPEHPHGPVGYRRPDFLIQDDLCKRLIFGSGIDLSTVSVGVQGGTVHLAGQVDNEEIRREIEEIAWSTFGVVGIENDLLLFRPEGRESPARPH